MARLMPKSTPSFNSTTDLTNPSPMKPFRPIHDIVLAAIRLFVFIGRCIIGFLIMLLSWTMIELVMITLHNTYPSNSTITHAYLFVDDIWWGVMAWLDSILPQITVEHIPFITN